MTWGHQGTVLTLQASLRIRGTEGMGFYRSTHHLPCSLLLTWEPGPGSRYLLGGSHRWLCLTLLELLSGHLFRHRPWPFRPLAAHSPEHQVSSLLNPRGSMPPPGLCPDLCSLSALSLMLTSAHFGFLTQEEDVGD